MPKYKTLQRIWSTELEKYVEKGEEVELNLEPAYEVVLINNKVLEPVKATVVRSKKKVKEEEDGNG